MNREAGAGGERHQGIEAEFADAAAQQIVEARLRHAETLNPDGPFEERRPDLAERVAAVAERYPLYAQIGAAALA